MIFKINQSLIFLVFCIGGSLGKSWSTVNMHFSPTFKGFSWLPVSELTFLSRPLLLFFWCCLKMFDLFRRTGCKQRNISCEDIKTPDGFKYLHDPLCNFSNEGSEISVEDSEVFWFVFPLWSSDSFVFAFVMSVWRKWTKRRVRTKVCHLGGQITVFHVRGQLEWTVLSQHTMMARLDHQSLEHVAEVRSMDKNSVITSHCQDLHVTCVISDVSFPLFQYVLECKQQQLAYFVVNV